jgi:hypothetical protein
VEAGVVVPSVLKPLFFAVLQFLVDHIERTADTGALSHDLPKGIDQALANGGFNVACAGLIRARHRVRPQGRAQRESPGRDVVSYASDRPKSC